VAVTRLSRITAIKHGSDEILARGVNLIIGKAAFETAKRLYARDCLEYRNGAQVIERSGANERLLYSARHSLLG
jgi:hypothetical protein